MGEDLQRPLTLVSAAAGFGKTTLLAAWLASLGEATPPIPSAWLQLDAEASDPVVFANHLLAAVQTRYPNVGGELLVRLREASRPPLPDLARSLLNELDQIEERFALVLDDYQRIQEEAVHELLAILLEHLPPQMHVAIASRTDPPLPLNSLRARGRVLEIRADDLRFTPEESHAFLEGVVGRELDQGTTDLLRAKTEGWVTGLRLAALSMHGMSDIRLSFFVQRFNVISSAYVADYLLDEVLDRQRPEVQEFMLRVSILDRFCAELCDAVLDDTLASRGTGGPQTTVDRPGSGAEVSAIAASSLARRPSSRSEATLAELDRSNLFLVPLDEEGIWYRFHQLFQDLLHHRLTGLCNAEELAALHARASNWFVERGQVDEALDHALAAGDVDSAALIVEQNRKVVLVDDQWPNLARWLDRLPAEVKQQRTQLLLAQAWIIWARLDLELFPSILEALEEALAREGASDPVQGELDFFRGYLAYFQALGPQAEEYYANATQRIPETYHTARWEAELHYALAHHMNGRGEMAVDRLTDLLRSRRVSRNHSRSRLWAGLCFIHLLEGDLPEAIHPAQRMQDLAAADKNQLVQTWASYLETSVHYRWNDLERAVRHFNELAGQPYTMDTTVAVDVHCALSLAYQHLQRSDQADETVRRLLGLTRQASVPLYRTIASSIQARLSLLRGDTESAVHWLQTADLAADAGIMLWWLEVPRLTECRVLIAEGSDASLQEAVDKLERYDQENEAVHNTCQRITILPLLALATHNRGRTDEALAILGRAVVLAEPGGFIRPFADLGAEMAALLQELVARGFADASMRSATVRYLNQVFAAFPEPVAAHDAATSSPAPGTAAGLVEALTGREMEVLALLDRRLTNQEIARELVITVGTVKQHTNSIYGKLGVGDRRLAVARARSLGLLPQ
jgi:LuxR family maltose regulon positive regulatory protein